MFFLSTWTSCRPRRKMRGRNGTRRTLRAKGRNVALALAPRTCFLKVALPLKRGAHFSLANLSGAWGPSGASWGPLGPPEASCGLLGPPGTSCGLLGPHPYSLLIYTPTPPSVRQIAPQSGGSHPNLQKTIQNQCFPFQHGRHVVHVAKCVAGMGRGALHARQGEMSLSP